MRQIARGIQPFDSHGYLHRMIRIHIVHMPSGGGGNSLRPYSQQRPIRLPRQACHTGRSIKLQAMLKLLYSAHLFADDTTHVEPCRSAPICKDPSQVAKPHQRRMRKFTTSIQPAKACEDESVMVWGIIDNGQHWPDIVDMHTCPQVYVACSSWPELLGKLVSLSQVEKNNALRLTRKYANPECINSALMAWEGSSLHIPSATVT